jgi:predicted ATPase
MPLRSVRARLAGAGLELKVGFAAGAAANTAITITGIKPSDQLVSVLELQPPSAASGDAIVADRTPDTTISAADTITIAQETTGNQVLVVWWSV